MWLLGQGTSNSPNRAYRRTNSKPYSVWLDDVSKTLESIPTTSGNGRSYDGFDVSSGMFPVIPQKGMSFHIQNMFEVFPKEFHGKYDFVHIRFVIGATTGDTYKIIAQNLLSLLSEYTLPSRHPITLTSGRTEGLYPVG